MTSQPQAKKAAFVVAGTHSGVGKTTVTLALLRAMAQRGLLIQPFKLGPDFIDSAYHEEMSDRPSINLDLWMMGEKNVRHAFERFSSGVDVALIEAMGALYDGEDGTERGSAAYLSKLLDIPVVLVIDVWGMTRSTIPLLDGFLSFDRDVRFAGFVMNRAGSARHVDMINEALPKRLRKLSLGYVLHRSELKIPERHLGLVTVQENSSTAQTRRAAVISAGATLNIDRLLPKRRSRSATELRLRLASTSKKRTKIGIARDAAFSFYYHENLALLEDAGAELVPFSPVSARALPKGISGLYIGGGYPESFAAALASNSGLKEQIRTLAGEEMPIYAECGGFMYLGRSLSAANGSSASMVGVFPIDTLMDPDHLVIRYVSVRTTVDSPLGPAGTVARGQEFHQSRITNARCGKAIYDVTASTGEHYEEGQLTDCAVGSYIHLHFSSNPHVAENFVARCSAWARRRRNQ